MNNIMHHDRNDDGLCSDSKGRWEGEPSPGLMLQITAKPGGHRDIV